jgi:hypothetical protein
MGAARDAMKAVVNWHKFIKCGERRELVIVQFKFPLPANSRYFRLLL